MILRLLLLLLVACQPYQEPQEPVITYPSPEVIPEPVIQEPEPVPEPCIDSDGFDLSTAGRVTIGNEVYSDVCINNEVMEYSCNGVLTAESFACPHGCLNGRCLPTPVIHNLILDGECSNIANADFSVTQCYNDCLSNTMCEPKPLETSSFSLPHQLNCLVRDDSWVAERWIEFDVLNPILVNLSTSVIGSEALAVELRKDGKYIAAPIHAKMVADNRCFLPSSGSVLLDLTPGQYEVRIGARAVGTDKFRSFRGKDLTLAIYK